MIPNYLFPPNQQLQIQQMMQQQSAQNGGFMVVPNEDVVKTYPVAAGNCITFKIEGKPIVMEKSMGFSQFETPRIVTYRLVKEEDTHMEQQEPHTDPVNVSTENNTVDELRGEIKAIWSEIEAMKSKRVSKRKEVTENDSE